MFLRAKLVIAITKAILQRIHSLSTSGPPSLELTPEIVNIRVFLAGFMIAYRPTVTHVFESVECLEHALLEAATPLISSFEKILDAIKRAWATGSFHDVPSDLTMEFPTPLFKYLKAFKAWKVARCLTKRSSRTASSTR